MSTKAAARFALRGLALGGLLSIVGCSENAPGNPGRESISAPRTTPVGDDAAAGKSGTPGADKAAKAAGGAAGRKIDL